MSDTDIEPGSGPSPLEAPPVDAGVPTADPPPAGGAEGAEKSDKKISLRDQLKASFEAAKEPEKEKSPAKQAAVQDRARDDKGRLLPKEAVEAPAKAAPVKTETIQKDAQPATGSTPVAGPPPGWSQASKQLYASLPDPIKADILKREKEVSDGFKKYSDDAKRYQEIEQVMAPLRPVYQQNGIPSDAAAIRHLAQWEANFRNPDLRVRQQAAIALLNQIGIDPASFAQSNPSSYTGQDQVQQQLQPYLNPVYQTVNSVKTELDNLRNERAAQDISAFSKDKPYFERVKVEMGKLIATGNATDLESAYQRAIWADADIRTELMQKEVDDKITAKTQQDLQRSQQARKAAVSPTTRAPSAPLANGKEPSKGVRGSIMAAVHELRESERA